MIGLKVYNIPDDFSKFSDILKKYSVDTLFLGDNASLDINLYNFFRDKLQIFYIFKTFFNPNYLEKHPEAYAKTSNGDSAIDEWVEFVCPSNLDYQNYLLDHLEYIIKTYNPSGISFDFIRQFIFWEKVYNKKSSRLIKSCVCPSCRSSNLNSEELITRTLKSLTIRARELNPNLKLDFHAVPWKKNEFLKDELSLCGQNLKELSKYVDFITPMCYAPMLKKNPSWIHSVVKDHYRQTGKDIIPAIQGTKCYIDKDISTKEYLKMKKFALKKPSKGFIMWNLPK